MGFFHACISISTMTLLVYDYAITLPREVKYVWKAPFSTTGVPLFYLNRYIPFTCHIGMVLFSSITSRANTCHAVYHFSLWLIAIGATITHAIIYLQTCALWNNDRKIVIPFGIILLVRIPLPCMLDLLNQTHRDRAQMKTVIAFALLSLQLKYTTFYDLDSFRPEVRTLIGKGCFITATEFIARWTYLVVFLTQALTIGVTLLKAFEHLRRSRSGWVYQLYRNGIIYLFVILVLSLLNTVLPNVTRLPPAYSALLAPIQNTLESVLCSRVMFIILKQQSHHRTPNTSHNDQTDSDLSKCSNALELNNITSAPVLTSFYLDEASRHPTMLSRPQTAPRQGPSRLTTEMGTRGDIVTVGSREGVADQSPDHEMGNGNQCRTTSTLSWIVA